MTSALPAVAARVSGHRPSDVCSTATRLLPNRTDVSQERDGCPQLRSRTSACEVRRAMIAAMHKPPGRLLTDWPSGPAGYTSAYRSACTVVYAIAKEVS
jgi:hypothetical protein